LPVAEAVAVSQVVVATIKFATARQRPYAHYKSTTYGDSDEARLSFPSGHAALGFALTTGAAMVCHWRHYKTEPYVWVAGIGLSLSVEYLRIAADKHWFTDVAVGGGIGFAAGLIVPTLLEHNAITIAPVPNGAAVVGLF
jgi:membrane-associated phospholipid phosphatase